ncbi:Uncharacterized protein Adt_18319 [Abeliophyllum distichum]|uniref:Uncharacterized protein n=1 Tax=Abeliophyllum distichum TaxID=126358 RepID=A0ABD1TJ09_9LAMI
MITAVHNGKRVGVSKNGSPVHDKQMPGTQQKMALRDVKNGDVESIQKQQESLLFGGGRTSADAIKVSGINQLTPECPSGLPGRPSLAYNGENENVKNARLRFQLELDGGRLQKMDIYSDSTQSRNMCQLPQDISQKQTQMRETHIHRVPVAKSNHMTPGMTISSGGSSMPSSLGKQSKNTQIDFMRANYQLRTERFIRLHKFLQQCDEAKQVEYIKMLLHLSPAELSKHAVEFGDKNNPAVNRGSKRNAKDEGTEYFGEICPSKEPDSINSFVAFQQMINGGTMVMFWGSYSSLDEFWP